MKAIQLVAAKRPLELREVAVPSLGTNDVLIRVRAAGICHSDAHYRSGLSRVDPLPLTLGHEVAGVIEDIGRDVPHVQKGDRVCVHYMVTCGHCEYCDVGTEQFCTTGKMVGKYRDGGFAEYIVVPERSVFCLPDEIPFEQGAIMMCSSATSLHALNKTKLKAGETITIFGVGGLGISAVQLARTFCAGEVYAVDINPKKLELAKKFGAIPIDASVGDPVEQLKQATKGRGVDVALELIGLPETMRQAVQCLAIMGRAGLVGLTRDTFEIAPYEEILNKEAQVIGVSDHLASEIPLLLEFARRRKLDLSHGIIKTVPLTAKAVNDVLDGLEKFSDDVRVVITP